MTKIRENHGPKTAESSACRNHQRFGRIVRVFAQTLNKGTLYMNMISILGQLRVDCPNKNVLEIFYDADC